ncbi:MAG: YraN family protein [Clostridiales bacterium]|nr:YraN family protein [Clostridiales bacterium]
MNNRQTGNAGEDMACTYIKHLGMEVMERNWHCGHEEIDIIARDVDTVAFIEVKYRLDDSHGLPQEAVTRTKQKSIVRAALGYMKQHGLLDSRVRFDVCAIYKTQISYFRNAFDATGMGY